MNSPWRPPPSREVVEENGARACDALPSAPLREENHPPRPGERHPKTVRAAKVSFTPFRRCAGFRLPAVFTGFYRMTPATRRGRAIIMAYPSPENRLDDRKRKARRSPLLRRSLRICPARTRTHARGFSTIFRFAHRAARRFISLSLPLLRPRSILPSPHSRPRLLPPTPPFSRALFERVA